MITMDPNQPFYDPSFAYMPPYFGDGNEMFMNQPIQQIPRKSQRNKGPSLFSRIPSLDLPAIILLAFSWLLHTLATFIPYWSTYSGIDGSRAGLWSARNFNYTTIQNFYFPETTDFSNLTNSVRFTNSNTKGYIVTVQFLMTFNFVVILIVLGLLAVDYIFSQISQDTSRGFLIQDYNSYDTVFKFGLLLYILYVFVIFEFAAWITYVGSRHDNNWKMHVSFAFTVIVSAFLAVVFIMYVIEFIKRFQKPRMKWQYWYGQYIEWGFFVYLSALLLLLIVICCPEWAYNKIDTGNVFREIGLFKQCYLSVIYKKNPSTGFCTLSDSKTNQAWVDATQAFMLMAYIICMLILIVIVVFRKAFLHNEQGYFSDRVPQPIFTYVIAGLIFFFGFIFTLIGISIFGAKVFRYSSIDVNWGYILAVFAMVFFLIAGILFILDAAHSQQQAAITDTSAARNFFFPAPLNHRVLSMQPLLKPEPAWQPEPPILPLPPIPPWQMGPSPWDSMYPVPNFPNPPFFPPQQMMMMPQNYAMDQYAQTPIAQAGLSNYVRQMQNNQGLMNYSSWNPLTIPDNRNTTDNSKYIGDMIGQHILQQQRLNINHERLLERYHRIHAPRVSTFQPFGSSTLPGRNYGQYLEMMGGDSRYGNSLAAMSRAGIGSSDETYRWMGGDNYEQLPNDINSIMQFSRNEPMSFVEAEKSQSINMYEHPIFNQTPASIRSLDRNRKYSEKSNVDDQSENEVKSENSDRQSNHYQDISTVLPSDTGSTSAAVPRENSTPSNRSTLKTDISRPLEPIPTGLSSLSSNTLNNPLASLNSTSASVIPHQNLSNNNNEPSSTIPPSGLTITSLNPRKTVSSVDAPSVTSEDDVSSSSDDDNDGKKRTQSKKRLLKIPIILQD